jgi:ATP-binding cassette subfamily B protein
MRADVIHVIDKGQIIESGTHRQLLEKNGFYAESWKSQMQIAGEQQIPTDFSASPPDAGRLPERETAVAE